MQIQKKLLRNYMILAVLILCVVNAWSITTPLPKIGLPVNAEDLDYETSFGVLPYGVVLDDHPEGHPGIDFSWNYAGDVLAVVNARVLSISADGEGKVVTLIPIGFPFTTIEYREMVNLSTSIKVGAVVNRGDVIGHPEWSGYSFKFHFSVKQWVNMFNPMVIQSPELYFDEDALAAIGRSINEPGTMLNKSKYKDREEYPLLSNPINLNYPGLSKAPSWIVGVIILGGITGLFFILNHFSLNKSRKRTN